MRVDWILLAEGLGQDAKGAITAIGLNQNVLAVPSLPASTKRAVVAHLVADEGALKPGDQLNLRFSVTSPSGQVIVAHGAQATIGRLPWPDLPASSDLPVELGLTFHEYGTHQFEVAVQAPGSEEMKGQLDFYVVATPDSQGEREPAADTPAT